MRSIIKKLNMLLDGKQKRTMVGLVLMMFVSAALETTSIALVLSVVTLIISPDAVSSNELLAGIYNGLGFKDYRTFEIIVMVALIIAFILKNVYLFIQWRTVYNFVYRNQFRTSERMMKNYIRRNYEFFLFADTAVVQRNITSDVNNMYALILSLLTITSEGIVFLALVSVLLILDPLMCILIGALLLLTMGFVAKVLKPIMHKAGKDNQDFYSSLFKWISQTVQGIKEIKVGGRERYFVNEYIKCGNGYVNAVERYSLYNNTPKLLLESVCISGMVVYMLILVLTGQDITAKIPIITAFATAAIKLMPSANKINNQLNSIAFCEPAFLAVADKLSEEMTMSEKELEFTSEDAEKLPVTDKISLKDITFKYKESDRYIFEKANMEIPIGSAVGVVGASGAGKTTIVDILLGLLEIENGAVFADGVNIRDNYGGWLKNIGYIPQMIYMIDGSIRDNVAFGIPAEKRDEKRIWEVLREAQLDEFVKSLPEGLDTEIGERGVRLSGGQRQRIGIARALYGDPEVLVLDEATSALDNGTEAAIMDSINSLHGKKTLIIIAHRLQTIEKCDIVYRVAEGKIDRER